MSFRAFVVDNQDGNVTAGIRELDESDLPAGDVTVRVEWSSVNYKDGLATAPGNRVIRTYPMTPGIDLAGTVVDSNDGRFAKGDGVVVIGHDLGVAHPGGFAELARVPGDWVIPLPEGLNAKEAMALGTAGFTAAMSVDALERWGLTPDNGTIIVTGATGGVGSTAVSMLAGRGYTVAGSTGKSSEGDYLRSLGATEVLSREEVSAPGERPLERSRWAGAVDPVGGATTAYLARTTRYGGAIALSGLTGGTKIETTVMPFILNAVALIGIDSVNCSRDVRERTWQRCATDLKPAGLLDTIAFETDLDGVPAVLADILQGKVRGRALVRLA